MERVANVVSIDACFDLGNENKPIRSDAYVNKMVLQQPNFLLNYANIGFQSYCARTARARRSARCATRASASAAPASASRPHMWPGPSAMWVTE